VVLADSVPRWVAVLRGRRASVMARDPALPETAAP